MYIDRSHGRGRVHETPAAGLFGLRPAMPFRWPLHYYNEASTKPCGYGLHARRASVECFLVQGFMKNERRLIPSRPMRQYAIDVQADSPILTGRKPA